MSSANYPHSQRQLERQNQLVDSIRCVVEDEPYSWPRAVAVVQFAHNTAVNATTGYTPHELLFGQESRRPETLLARQLSLSGILSDEKKEKGECQSRPLYPQNRTRTAYPVASIGEKRNRFSADGKGGLRATPPQSAV